MAKRQISERKVILITAGLIILSGLIQMVNYSFGSTLYYLVFSGFLAYRLIRIVANRRKKVASFQRYRIVLLVVMLITLVMNIAGWQQADFFLIFLLMVDFLLLTNRKI